MSYEEAKKAVEIGKKIQTIEDEELRQQIRVVYKKLVDLCMWQSAQYLSGLTAATLTITPLIGRVSGFKIFGIFVVSFVFFVVLFGMLYFHSKILGIFNELKEKWQQDENMIWVFAQIRQFDPNMEALLRTIRSGKLP